MIARKVVLLLLAAVGVLGLVRQEAKSYVFWGPRWGSAFARMYVNTTHWTSSDRAQITTACGSWTAVEGSSFRFQAQIVAWDPNVALNWNNQNDIYVNDLGPATLGITMIPIGTTTYMTEADIEIHTTVAMGIDEDMQSVVLHELGHVVGLDHEDDVPAVMNTYGSLVRILFPDDEDGIRALYPDTSIPPPPPGPDIAISSISHFPSLRLGEEIEVSWTFENKGDAPSGSFDAVLFLDGEKTPGPETGQEMGRMGMPPIGMGATGGGTLRAQIPDVLLPGEWYLGVRAMNVYNDINGANNAAAPPRPLEIQRDAVTVGPRDKALGTLGPYGKDQFRIDLPVGVKVSAKLKAARLPDTRSKRQVSALLGLHRPGISIPFDWDFGRKPRIKRVTDQQGNHEVRVTNDLAVPLVYKLKLKVADQALAGEMSTGSSVPFHAWAGGALSISVKGDAGSQLTMTLVDPDGHGVDLTGALKVKAGGRKLKLKLGTVPMTGEYTLTIGGTPSGYVRYSIAPLVPTIRVTHAMDD